jgi:hypothetical protein
VKHILKLRSFIHPYVWQSILALIMLTAVVFVDLAIPRLIEKIIDQGIALKNPNVILNTTLWMLGLTVLSALLAIGNNLLSVQVGEGYGRDLRDALYLKIQSFSFGNLDRMKTGQLMCPAAYERQHFADDLNQPGSRSLNIPPFVGYRNHHRGFHLPHAAHVPGGSTPPGQSEYCFTGKHCRSAGR